MRPEIKCQAAPQLALSPTGTPAGHFKWYATPQPQIPRLESLKGWSFYGAPGCLLVAAASETGGPIHNIQIDFRPGDIWLGVGRRC